jgi:hypothetical protein
MIEENDDEDYFLREVQADEQGTHQPAVEEEPIQF